MTGSTDGKKTLDELINDPSAHFENPSEVLRHTDLALADKKAILESWKVDEEEKSTATAENMGTTDSNQLSDVITALQQLNDEENKGH